MAQAACLHHVQQASHSYMNDDRMQVGNLKQPSTHRAYNADARLSIDPPIVHALPSEKSRLCKYSRIGWVFPTKRSATAGKSCRKRVESVAF